MRTAVAPLAALVAIVPAFARDLEPVVRDCSTSAYGDLGRDWRRQAVLAGPLAFAGIREGYRHVPSAPAGRSWPLKLLVVVEPGAVATVTIGARSRRFASLFYDTGPLPDRVGDTVPISAGSLGVRFEACTRPHQGHAWNRGTQFPGYFLVGGRRCVEVEVRLDARTKVLRRTLRFGRTRCAGT
jgi:hypothetical protein